MALTQLTQISSQAGISTTIDYTMSDLVVDTISVGGTITYNDVTSVDSIGIITARKGIQVLGDGLNVTGVTTISTTGYPQLILKDSDSNSPNDTNGISLRSANNTEYGFIGQTESGGHSLFIKTVATTNPIRLQVNSTTRFEAGNSGCYVTGVFDVASGGTSSLRGDVYIPDKLRHIGDDDTNIRFPANDTISFETAGSERVRITSGGTVNIGGNYTQTTYKTQIQTGTNKFISFTNAAHDDLGNEGSAILFSRQSDGSKELSGIFGYGNTSLGLAARADISFHAGGSSTYGAAPERLRINSTGQIGICTDTISSDDAIRVKLDGAREYLRLDADAANNNAYIEIQADDNRRKALIFKSGGTRRGVIGIGDSDEAANATSLFFSASDKIAGNDPHMVIDSSGRMGLGTASPTSLFMMQGAAPRITLMDTGGTNDYAKIFSTGGALYLQQRDDSAHGKIIFRTEDNSGAIERLRIDSSGNTLFRGDTTGGSTGFSGFGTHNWAPKVQVLHSQGALIARIVNNDAWGGALHLASANGTYASPSATTSGDIAGGVYFHAHDGGDFLNYVAGIEAIVADTVATNDTPGYLKFSTTADGTNSLTERLRITSNGQVRIGDGAASDYSISNDVNAVLQLTSATTPKAVFIRNDTSISSGNHLGLIDFHSRDGGPVRCARIGAVASGTHATGDNPTDLIFRTCPDGSASDEERLRITAAGDMGLGCTNPGADPAIGNDATVLEIRQTTTGNITSGNNRKGAVLRLKHEAQWENGYQNSSPNDDLGRVEFVTGDGSIGEGVRSAIRCRNLQYFNKQALTFEVATADSTSLLERMRITSNGFIGVGVESPNHMLQLHRSDSNNSYTQYTNATTGSAAGDGVWLGMGGDEICYLWHQEDKDMALGTNNTERLRITNTGEVNIGGNYTQSTVPLCVTTGANDYGIRLQTGSKVVMELLNNDSAGNCEIRGNYNNNTGTQGEGFRLEANGDSFFNPGGTTGLKIKSDGNVGVNVSNPTQGKFVASTTSGNTAAFLKDNNGAAIAFGGASQPRILIEAQPSSSDLLFYTASGSSWGSPGWSEKVRITSGGKIGINYAATPPSEDVMIRGSSTTAAVTLQQLSGGNSYGTRIITRGGANTGFKIGTQFNSSYNEKIEMNGNGQVVISLSGDTNQSTAWPLNLTQSGNYNGTYPGLCIKSTSTGGGNGFSMVAFDSNWGLYTNSGNRNGLAILDGTSASSANAKLVIGTDGVTTIGKDAYSYTHTSRYGGAALHVAKGSLSIGGSSSNTNAYRGGVYQLGWYITVHSGNSYYHLKTDLWAGGSPHGNTQYIMGGFRIEGYSYSSPTGSATAWVQFHNWSGAYPGLNIKTHYSGWNMNATVYTSSDGYVVLRLAGGTYKSHVIDLIQHIHYPSRDINVTATAANNNATHF